MTHRIICIVMLLMLALQGVTLAAADVLPADKAQSMEHCAGHDEESADCACCSSNSDMMGVNCASQCAVAASICLTSLAISPQATSEAVATVNVLSAGPIYSPLNPPPIA